MPGPATGRTPWPTFFICRRFPKPETGLEPVTPCLEGVLGVNPQRGEHTRGYWGFGSLDRSASAVPLPWLIVDFRELRQDCQNPRGSPAARGGGDSAVAG